MYVFIMIMIRMTITWFYQLGGNNTDALRVYKIISIGINEILVHKGVPLFHFILKLGMIKIMSGLIEIPFLKKIRRKYKNNT